MTKPDLRTAAIRAMETLILNNITASPVMPLPILKKMPNVLVISFTEISESIGVERGNVISTFGSANQDAITSVHICDGIQKYIVAYNQQLPMYMLQRALARELGHIILSHDGSRPEDVRNTEAKCFAYHLLCPRPLIRSVQESGIRLTTEVVGNLTGCYERCLAGMRKTPGVDVPAYLNVEVKEMFAGYVSNFLNFQKVIAKEDESSLADFGTYMDNYME